MIRTLWKSEHQVKGGENAFSEAEAGEILQEAQFENAYELLMIRSCTEEALADAAAFWTAQRDAVLREKESQETELAPAA